MIDCHILTHSGTRHDWLSHCLMSLAEEAELTVHVMAGVDGHVGQGRAAGYRVGYHEYVTFVDSDDWVYPGVGAELVSALKSGANGVCTMERIIVDQAGAPLMRHPRGGHGLWAWRREAIDPHLAEVELEQDFPDRILPQRVGYVQIPFVGRAWRIHQDNYSRAASRRKGGL